MLFGGWHLADIIFHVVSSKVYDSDDDDDGDGELHITYTYMIYI